MANTPKSKDPVDAALTAVEEALRIDFDAPAATNPRTQATGAPRDRRLEPPRLQEAPRKGDAPRRADAPRKVDAPPAAANRPLPSPTRTEEPAASPRGRQSGRNSRMPANDDRRVGGASLPARRPSRLIYPLASLLSIAWVGAIAAYVSSANISLFSGDGAVGSAQFTNIALALVLPVGIVWGIAMMVARAQEMRIAARSISDVAARLSEPEEAASEAVVTVSQAIRREVAAMGDGIERALARASELELLVHNEVAALERSYSDNEVRMRGLIDDLANQREAIVINSERVRTSIVSAQESLSKDLGEASEQIAANIIGSGDRITQALAGRGDSITSALGTAGDEMINKLSLRGEDLVSRLTGAATDVTESFSRTSAEVTDVLLARSADINETLETTGRAMAETVAERGREVNETLARVTEELTEGLDRRTADMT
ncbi:MAG: hypothetical protein J0H20_04225, partial [Rhizobiales bacterium]|nr:hypothetical protein [Hyphomicrobiales bacterium]